MNPVVVGILWTYTGLLLVGGLMGFLKAGSKASLVASVLSAIPLGLVAAGILPVIVANVVLAALVIVFAGRYAKTRKFMPSGMLIVLSAAADVALLYLQFAGPKA
jgi:uncharacterized membrane protein (UPF0136 family)